MKRKLNEDGIPTPVDESESPSRQEPLDFEALQLDSRILQAIVKEGLSKPTAVQARAIPLALEGRDILARAKTGSGKTLAYVLPILESILRKKAVEKNSHGFTLILVPTKELGEQVNRVLSTFSAYCTKSIRVLNLAQKTSEAVQRSLLSEKPDVVVATPAGARAHFESASLDLSKITSVIIDEADLVLSFGYEDDVRVVADAIPNGVQSILMSATVGPEVDTLQQLFCQDPVVLELDQEGEESNPISQFVVKCTEQDKFLLIYVIIKLKLIKGKCIIFVGDIDRCYRLKLFLEQFGAKSCVLNSELPVNSRLHVVEAFNKNVYDVIVAADENEVIGSENIRKKRRTAKDKEFGISRGIDFKNVACVLNFDLPTTAKSYIHRIGRTGRAGKTGMALSFVIPKSEYRKHKPTSFLTTEHDEEVLSQIVRRQQKKGQEIKDYQFDMTQVEAFRYRINDALKAVTGVAVREARTRELRQELINSEKLKRHFEENPQDLNHLRHDGELRAARVQSHLKHIPDYLMPAGGKKTISEGDIGFVPFRKTDSNKAKKAHRRVRQKGRPPTGRRANPLKTFSAKGRKKT